MEVNKHYNLGREEAREKKENTTRILYHKLHTQTKKEENKKKKMTQQE